MPAKGKGHGGQGGPLEAGPCWERVPVEAGEIGSGRGAQRKAGVRGREVQRISFHSRRGGHAVRGQSGPELGGPQRVIDHCDTLLGAL